MSPSDTLERIKHTVPVSWVNSCKLWPAVTAFMFAFVPLEYRSIFGGVIAIGWQTYLSLLNQRAAAQEEQDEEHDKGHNVGHHTATERQCSAVGEKCEA